jgi:uncharacterized protein
MALPPVRSGHYPHQVPIDAYGNGGFRFADMSHRGSMLCLPSGMHAWEATEAATLDRRSLSLALDPALGIEVLLIGTGEELCPLSPELKQAFRDLKVVAEPMSTGGAVRTYNVLLAEERPVGAALIAVERAR